MDVSLPVLSWEEVWNDIGKQYPTLAGTAFLIWAAWGYRVGTCLYYAVASRNRDQWAKRHETLSYAFRIADRRVSKVKVLEDSEHFALVVAELEKKFVDDGRVLQIIRMLMDGKRQVDIAHELGLSREAISQQVQKIRRSEKIREML